MDRETLTRLREINRRFYEHEAESFSASRNHPWPGWTRVLDQLPVPGTRDRVPGIRTNELVEPMPGTRDRVPGNRTHEAPVPGTRSTIPSSQRASVLDVGCGNGRLVAFLRSRWEEAFDYLGCDASEALLAEARAEYAALDGVLFQRCDLASSSAGEGLPAGPFTLVGVFGVLHHIPSFALRQALLLQLARRLAPGGTLALTFWRFAAAERFRRRVIPWPEYNRSAADPVSESALEPGDQLLRWGADAGPPRYCHFVDEGELARLLDHLLATPAEANDPVLREVDRYYADGRSQDLNHYILLRRSDA